MTSSRRISRGLQAGIALAVLSLVACGSGSGDIPAEPPPSTTSLVGLVADRAAWAGAEVTLDCVDGRSARAETASDGRYAITLGAGALPCLVQATSAEGDRMWSVATAAGTVNVTPASDWTVTRALRVTTAGLRPDRSMLRTLAPAAVAQAQADVRQALTASGLAPEGDLITAPLDGVVDELLASQQQVLTSLAASDIGPLSLRHALALHGDMAVLSTALLQGQLAEALALPSHRSDDASMPQLVSGLVSLLTGPADGVFGVNAEGSWRTTDGGRQWTYVNHVLAQVLRFRARLWARDQDGLLVSDDGGLSWGAAPAAPMACLIGNDMLLASPEGRLWFLPDSSCPGVRDHYTDDGLSWQSQDWDGGYSRLNLLQAQGLRQPPLRQVFFRDFNQESVTSCLEGSCVDSAVLDWPYVQWLLPVVGSGEIVAGLTDNRSRRPASMALSPDGISWQAMSFLPFNSLYRLPQGGLLASPGANAVAEPSTNFRVQHSDDDGKTWLPSDPAVNAVDGWITLGAETRLRRAASQVSQVQLSVDAGRSWSDLPDLLAQRDRRSWQRGPDGSLLRNGATALQASIDDGATWRDVVSKVGANANLSSIRGPVWLDDRWVAVTSQRLLTSANGLQWTDAPLGLTDTSWDGWSVSTPVSDGGIWVMSVSRFSTPGSPVLTELLESKDQGRIWAKSQRGDAMASACGGMRYLLRPRSSDGVLDWQLRTDADPVWRELPLPPGVERTSSTVLECDRGLLLVRVGGWSSSQRMPYANASSGARGLSHWLSPDHGRHWFAVGRPGTDLFRVDGRWWSLGLDSVMLWP